MKKMKALWIVAATLMAVAGTAVMHGCGTTTAAAKKFTILGAGN